MSGPRTRIVCPFVLKKTNAGLWVELVSMYSVSVGLSYSRDLDLGGVYSMFLSGCR